MLPLMEKFYSIQGEGRRVGYNSLFIRFGGCNLRCPGFKVEYETPDGEKRFGCDSWYSVDPKFRKEWNIVTSFNEVVAEADLVIPKSTRIKYDVVITGGEPTMHWKNPEFQNLLVYYISRGHKVTIETNASLDIEFTEEYQREIMFSMSVKLENSGEQEHKRINIENISNILANTSDSYLKFVIDAKNADKAMSEIGNILKEVPFYSEVFLMPMGATNKELNENRKTVAQLCINNDFMYSDRAHIAIWNDEPGV